jgi:arylsulfatase
VRKQVLTQRWPWFLAAGLLIAVFVASTLSERRRTGDWDRRPLGTVADIEQLRGRSDLNVLFIVVDTLRAERLSSYGYERDTSPILDRLASSGVRFERHLGQSTWTKSSMASLWTGLYPAHTGITRYDDVIPDAAQMPAEVLREAGFQTFGLWRNGWVSPTFGFEQGFDVYQRPLATALPPNVRRANPTLSEKGTDEGLADAAVEFARVNGNKRWFLYLHMMDLHEYIYDAESALFGSTHSDLYDNSIRWTDGSLGQLLEKLAKLGQLDRTLVAIVSDHGEAFLERGFEGHAREVFRETTEVPFLLFFPFRLDPGIVVKTRTQNVDVWPTLYDILGITPPQAVDGRSLLPEILAGAKGETPQDGKRTAIADLDQAWSQKDIEPLPAISVVEDEFRYVRFEQRDGSGRVELLFDAKNDPRELRDRSQEEPDTFERLRAAADDYSKGKPAWGEAPTRQLSELELSLLRALGYKVP